MDTNLTENTTTLCRMCLQQINNFSQCHSLENQVSNDDSITVRYKLSRCIPELDLEAVPGRKICNDCFVAVNFLYDFKQKCLHTEKKIKTYLGGMFSSAAFVEFIHPQQVQQTLEIVHSGLLNENLQPVNIKTENRTDITKETSLHYQNMPNNELTNPQIQPVNNIKTEDYEIEVILCESPQQSDLQTQSNDMTDVQIQERSVDTIDVDSSDHKHELIDDPKFERNNVYTASIPSEPSISDMLDYTITNQNISNQSNIEIKQGVVSGSNPQYQCYICGLSFASNASLSSHRILCQSNQRLNNSLLKCSKCHFTCKYKSMLTYHENLPHINGVAVDNNSPYKCHVCTKQFAYPLSLSQHMQCHTPTTLKKCDECNYGTYFRKELHQHKLCHKKNLHKCPHCEVTMGKRPLNDHIRRKHSNLDNNKFKK